VNIAPDPILKAGLMTIHWATVLARNLACSPDAPTKMLYELMDAIHEVPKQNGIKIETIHRCVGRFLAVGREADVPNLAVLFGFQDRFHRTTRTESLLDLLHVAEGV